MSLAQEKRIFLSAIDFESKGERDAFLDQECNDDHSLRCAVNELLKAHDQQNNPLDQSARQLAGLRYHVDDLVTFLEDSSSEENREASDRTGELIGHYRLLEKIGEGAFGEVYVAQQEQPVRRRVAIKLLKLGMNSTEILARFEAERQALAMMDHPNIAQVFDAGTSSTGQPFFAMELVRGVPITQFCEQQQLGIRQRIELLIDVCQAVQHAHQKGVIHRDLKPSNVMVTLYDAKPVAKVIDFGVAKAIGEPLTSKTIYTRFMQLIGTPMYMSPEQMEMNALDIDTRCDVFSLGMLLYEVLTGTTPYDEQRLNTAPFDELRRIIREEELIRPSTRLSTLGKEKSTVASLRRVTRSQLMIELRGDLDWIVMKAVEKDRSRRYETASDFAQDLRRYLNGELVEARPPSRWYRFSKFADRNKVPITAGSMVLLAMLFGTGISMWQAARAVSERDAKELALEDAVRARREVEEFARRLREANILLASGRAHADAGRWLEAAADYSRATVAQPMDYHVWIERAALYNRLGLWKAAADDYIRALKLEPPVTGAEWWGVAQLLLFTGKTEHYRQLCVRMCEESSNSSDGSFEWSVRSCLFVKDPPIEAHTLVDMTRRLNERVRTGPPHGHPFADTGDDSREAGKLEAPSDRPGPHKKQGQRPHEQRGFAGKPFGKQGGSLPRGVGLYLMGLAYYREGDFERSVASLRSAMSDDPHWGHTMICHPALAMGYFRVGRFEESREALEKSNETIDDWATTMMRGELGTMPVPWFDFLECLLLHSEATELVTGRRPNADPRWLQIQDRAWAAIH